MESVNYIESYVKDLSEDKFFDSIQAQDSVIRRLEIIGEAVKNLPEDFKASRPEIPWQKIAGMRDNLIHEYFGVDADLVWNTIKQDLPELKRKIEQILTEFPFLYGSDRVVR